MYHQLHFENKKWGLLSSLGDYKHNLSLIIGTGMRHAVEAVELITTQRYSRNVRIKLDHIFYQGE